MKVLGTNRRYVFGVRLADGSYSSTSRVAKSREAARTDVVESLRRCGHIGWKLESQRLGSL